MKKKVTAGRPKTDASTHKKNRAISLTDQEYDRLKEMAGEVKLGVSAFIIYKLKLNKK